MNLRHLDAFGDDSSALSSIWFLLPEYRLRFSEVFIVSIGCDFDFTTYPFDSHTCLIHLKNWIGSPFRLQLNSPSIYTLNSTGFEIGGKEFNFTNGRLDYDLDFKSLPSETFIENGIDYSKALIQMNLTRTTKSSNKIFGSFHAMTGIFAFLSLISFFIHPDMVPGRMGLLITLYLILVNTYASIEAPSKRGISAIEVWFLAMQTPVLLAIIEYGIVLGLKKIWKWKTFDQNVAFQYCDNASFVVSVVFQIVFNAIYWQF